MTRLTQIERKYFVRKTGAVLPKEPLNNIKRRYMGPFIGSGITPQMSLDHLEKLWLQKVIGAPAVGVDDDATLWKLAAIKAGVTPSKYINDNKIKFYLNAV